MSKVTVDDRELRKIYRALKNVDVLVGIQGAEAREKKKVKDSQGNVTTSNESAVMVAAVHEFGSEDGTIPERSYLRSTVKEQNNKYLRLFSKVVNKGIRERREPEFAKVGEQAVTDVKRKIRSRIPPALKAATIARKGSSSPLIDTGQLIGSITSVVRKKKK